MILRTIVVIAPAVLLLLPVLAEAALVAPPCTAGVDGCPVVEREAPRYGTCELVATFQNVFRFALVLVGIFVTGMFVYVGLLLATSAGNTTSLEKGKSVLVNAIIGFLLMIGAFAIVNTIMQILLTDEDPRLLNWQSIQCIYADVAENGTLRNGGLGAAGNADLPEVTGVDLCNASYLGEHFPGEERIAQCVLQGESNCGSYFYSTTDINRNRAGERVPFSVSPWQINLTVHEIRAGDDCRSGPLDCKAAYSGKNFSAVLEDTDLYNRCIDALRDPRCSGSIAKRIRGAGWTQWSAYTNNRCGG